MDKIMNMMVDKIKVLLKNKYAVIGMVAILIIIIVMIVVLCFNPKNRISKDEIISVFDELNSSITLGELLIEEEPDVPLEEMNFGTNDYYDFMTVPLEKVNFNSLKGRNSDTVAWLHVNGTNINYPVVQAVNNTYYLNKSYTKATNASGWVFMDFRNDIHALQDNTIIYAHGQTKDTMFSSLKNILTSSWQENPDNHIVTTLTDSETLTWQVFSVYKIPTETYYLISSFGSDESHQKYIDTVLGRSAYNFNVDVNVTDKFLTLSTCLNDDVKIVLHAKLIERKAR